MKVFLSHSSRNKSLIREIKSYFPEHVKLWMDEMDLLIGDDVEGSIRGAIETDSDFVIIFIDFHTLDSDWVKKEMNWALSHEKEIGRNFLLPVILGKEVTNKDIPPEISRRKYLSCSDQSVENVKNLSFNIMAELFAWLSRDIEKISSSIEQNTTEIKLIDEADKFTAKAADTIRLIVYPFRKENSLKIEELHKLITKTKDFSDLKFPQLIKLLERLQNHGYLPGIIYDGYTIFLEEEHFAWKTAFHSTAKIRIATKAISLIKPGYVVALDAGSTTLELAKQIGAGIKRKVWKDLTIITNSISAASELLTVTSELGWDDSSSLIKVYIVGGRIRSNTLAVVDDDANSKLFPNTDFKNILAKFNKADIGFIGTNGIHAQTGFTTHSEIEIFTKRSIIENSKKCYVLTDPSKFGIRETSTFANFEDELDIITVKDTFEDTVEKYINVLDYYNIKVILA